MKVVKCTFLSLPQVLDKINSRCAEKGIATINKNKWSSHLSDVVMPGSSVKKSWVDQLCDGLAIKKENALTVLAAVNGSLKRLGLPMETADVLVEVASKGE